MTEFLNKNGINCDINNCSNYFENVELKNDILKDLETIGRKADFKGFEIIKKIYLSPEPFTSENDLCTPTLKIRRHVAKKYFANKIKELYNSN